MCKCFIISLATDVNVYLTKKKVELCSSVRWMHQCVDHVLNSDLMFMYVCIKQMYCFLNKMVHQLLPNAQFWRPCSGVAAGLAFFWNVHGEVPERNHPASCQALQPCTQNIHFCKDPLWTHCEFALLFTVHSVLLLVIPFKSFNC